MGKTVLLVCDYTQVLKQAWTHNCPWVSHSFPSCQSWTQDCKRTWLPPKEEDLLRSIAVTCKTSRSFVIFTEHINVHNLELAHALGPCVTLLIRGKVGPIPLATHLLPSQLLSNHPPAPPAPLAPPASPAKTCASLFGNWRLSTSPCSS